MKDLTNTMTFFVLGAVIAYYFVLPKDLPRGDHIRQALLYGALAGFLYEIYSSPELFHFEVTPWKTTCRNSLNHRCPQCCGPEFTGGMDLSGFVYTGDKERMDASRTCAMRKPGMKNKVDDYDKLKQTYCTSEGFESLVPLKTAYQYRDDGLSYQPTPIEFSKGCSLEKYSPSDEGKFNALKSAYQYKLNGLHYKPTANEFDKTCSVGVVEKFDYPLKTAYQYHENAMKFKPSAVEFGKCV